MTKATLKHEAGFAAVDALTALVILATTIALSIHLRALRSPSSVGGGIRSNAARTTLLQVLSDAPGPAAVRMIRARELAAGRRRTPILALTANAMPHQVAEYLAAGMDGHIAKPVEAGRLFEALSLAIDGGEDEADAGAA